MFYFLICVFMDKLNTPDKRNHKRYNSWRKLWYALVLAGLLDINTPTYAQTNTPIKDATEQVQPQIDKAWIQIPSIYQGKLDEFLKSNNVMKDNDAKNFTEDFISKEIESDRWISKENQLLFIRHSIYKQITNQDLYDGKDNDSKISEDFNNKLVNIRIRACWQKYKNWITSYMNELSTEADKKSAEYRQQSAEYRQQSAEYRQQSAEYRQQSTEYRQQSAEYRQQSAEALNSSLENLVRFYNRYKKDPSSIKDEEVKQRKEQGKDVIQRCKEVKIDYKAKLSNEMLKFYGIE